MKDILEIMVLIFCFILALVGVRRGQSVLSLIAFAIFVAGSIIFGY